MNKVDNFVDDLNMKGVVFNELFFDRPSDKINMQNIVKTILLEKKRDDATELCVDKLKDRFRFYSIRSDDKKELWIYETGIYKNNGATYIHEYCREVLSSNYTSNFANSVIEKISADSLVDADYFFNQNIPNEIAVLNGILNIDTNELLPFDENKIFFNKLPVEYDPSKKCPNIISFLTDIIAKPNDLIVLQELFGSFLHKEYKHEKCFMLIGDGRNGKGKMGLLIKNFLGSDNIANLQPMILENPESFSTHKLHGKLVNLSLDISKTALKNTSMLKSLSGRDLVTCQRKFKEPISFINYSKMVFGCNELPISYDTKNAFWERWILLEFPYTFIPTDRYEKELDKTKYKIKDPDILNTLIYPEELSGLLNWSLEGYHRLNKKGDFSYDLEPKEVMALWIRKSDSFGAFFMDYLEYSYDNKVLKNNIREKYVEYCREHTIKIVSDKAISKYMEEEGVMTDRIRNSDNDLFNDYFWRNLKIKDKYGYLSETGFWRFNNGKILNKENFDKMFLDNKLVSKKSLGIYSNKEEIETLINKYVHSGFICEIRSGIYQKSQS